MPADTDAARAMRALEELLRWDDSAPLRHFVGPIYEGDGQWSAWAAWGRDPRCDKGIREPSLPAAILSAHAALVAARELPPLPEAEAGDGGGA